MERYTRLVQLFNSSDKTISELYPFSPYTSSKFPLTEKNSPLGLITQNTSDDDFSGSEFSQENSVEPPLGRKLLLEDPPSRLHLKRRPKRKPQLEEKESQKQTSEDCQTNLNVPQWHTRSWEEAPPGDNLLEHTSFSFQQSDLPPRPPSRRNESRNSGSLRGSERENEDRKSPKLGRSVRRQENATPDQSPQGRGSYDHSTRTKGSQDRKIWSERVRYDRGNGGQGNHDSGSNERGSSSRSSSVRVSSSDKSSRDQDSSERVIRDRGSSDKANSDKDTRDRCCNSREIHDQTIRTRTVHDRESIVGEFNDPNSIRGSREYRSNDRGSRDLDGSGRDSQDPKRQDRTNQSVNTKDRLTPDSSRKRRRSPGTGRKLSPKTTDPRDRQTSSTGERTRNQELIHPKSPEKVTFPTKESKRSRSRSRKTLDQAQTNTEGSHPVGDEPSHRMNLTIPRNKEIFPGRPNQILNASYQNCSEDFYESHNEDCQRISDEKYPQTKATHQRMSEAFQHQYDEFNPKTTADTPCFTLSGSRPQSEESTYRTETEKSISNVEMPLLRERRFRTSNFTLPSSLSMSPTHLQTQLFYENDVDQGSPKRCSEQSLKVQQEGSHKSFAMSSPGKSTLSPPKSQSVMPTDFPLRLSSGSQTTNHSFISSPIGSTIQTPTSSELSQWFTPHSSSKFQPNRTVLRMSHQKCITSLTPTDPTLERYPKMKTLIDTNDSVDQSFVFKGKQESKPMSTQTRKPNEILAGKIESSLKETGDASFLLEKEKSRSRPPLAGSSPIKKNTTDSTTQTSMFPTKKSPQIVHEDAQTSVTEPEIKRNQSDVKVTVDKEHTEINKTWGLHAKSWLSTSSSDVTDGESILDIEKFKQRIKSVEVPPELLEPLAESEESDTLFHILETISESPLEDCSDVHNYSNCGDGVNGSVDELTLQNRTAHQQTSGDHTSGDHRDTSTSDVSDIQLHYAYERKQNDQLELQWIKLEKVVDTTSESSEGSEIESPFNRHGKSADLQILSVNLPNASIAQRHGDADRGPLATYLTLPTQSPASGDDPELAIIVLHEDNLSEHQKEVITRFRTGMKRRRSRSSSQISEHPSANQVLLDQSEQPLIIPISDPNSDSGSTTGFAVIADSVPEVPLSVDVDVKSWLANQHLEEDEPPILVNQRSSKGPIENARSSFSETHVSWENKLLETNRPALNATTFPNKDTGNNHDSFGGRQRLDPNANYYDYMGTTANTTQINENVTECIPRERPKTAPPCEGKEPSGNLHRGSIDQKLQLKRRSRNATSETPSLISQRTQQISHKTSQSSQRSSPSQDAYATQKPPVTNARSLKQPLSDKRTGNDRTDSSIPNSKHEVINKSDNTVQVLFEPRSKSAWKSKEEIRKSQNFNRFHIPESKPKVTDVDKPNNSIRPKSSNTPVNRRVEKPQEPEKPKSSRSVATKRPRPKKNEHPELKAPEYPKQNIPENPSSKIPLERPRTASPGQEQNRLQGFHGYDISEEAAKNPEKRHLKRSLSFCVTSSPEHESGCGDVGQVESVASIASCDSAGTPNPRKETLQEKLKRPQAAPMAGEINNSNIETMPVCDSCDSSASTDSSGVPRYRLKRNIAYLSEYRKTIDSLRAKCLMKDHMIDALLEELQSLSPPEETYKRLLIKMSNRNLNGPPPRRDYTCSEVVDLLPRERGESLPEMERPYTPRVFEEYCVCPSDFRVAGKVGCDSLLLTWKSAPNYETVAGYEVGVNGQLSQVVRSPTRTTALLMDLDLSREMRFTLRTLRKCGLQACHPPLEILFAPSYDDWALDDFAHLGASPPSIE